MASILPADPTLDEIRAALAPLIASSAAFDGFGAAALAGWLAFGELLGPIDIFGGMMVGAALVLIRLPSRRTAPI